MRKLKLVAVAGVALLVLAAVLLLAKPSAPPTNISSPSNTSGAEPILQQPLMAVWTMPDMPQIQTANLSWVAHAMVISDRNTAIVYSMPAAGVNSLLGRNGPSLTDNAGKSLPFLKRVALQQVGSLEVGVLLFAPVNLDSQALTIVSGSDKASPVALAHVVPPDVSTEDLNTMTSSIYRENYAIQGGYRISVNGWGPIEGDRVATMLNDPGETTDEVFHSNATEAANLASPAANPFADIGARLSNGEPVVTELTLRIEDTGNQAVQYVYIQFMASGEVRSTLLP